MQSLARARVSIALDSIQLMGSDFEESDGPVQFPQGVRGLLRSALRRWLRKRPKDRSILIGCWAIWTNGLSDFYCCWACS
jgi:hypothetical protein